MLKEQYLVKLSIEITVILLEPINVSKLKKIGFYECPLYKTSKRKEELSTTRHSVNFVIYFYLKYDEMDVNKDYENCIRRGTALLTQLDK